MNTYSPFFFLSSYIADRSKQVLKRHATNTAYNNIYAQDKYSMRLITGMGNDQQCKHKSLKEHTIKHNVLGEDAKGQL